MDERILVVEDRLSQRRFIGDVLRLEGFQVVETGNYEQARAILLSDSTICLLILDQMVPGMTGTDFLTQIRMENEFRMMKDMPAIFLTAYPEDKDVRAFQSNGVRVLAKPLEGYQDLIIVVKEILARKIG